MTTASDDFGTGSSSLSDLRHLPAQIIKVHRPAAEREWAVSPGGPVGRPDKLPTDAFLFPVRHVARYALRRPSGLRGHGRSSGSGWEKPVSAGLVALLDDVAAIAKLAAASLDDVAAAAGKAGVKAIGIVVDDTAVTPRYVTGFTPDRELPIIWRIAKGSLRNKVVFILPVALLLSQFLPWAITPILMLGGAYLCYEGAEKASEAVSGHTQSGHADSPVAADSAVPDSAQPAQTSPSQAGSAREEQMVAGAIRTDLILSAEIMAISLAEVADQTLVARALSLMVVAFLITLLVYGVVGLVVKADDFGLRLARSGLGAAQAFGRGLVRGMPGVMAALSVIGTAAMLWVGGHILLAGLEEFGLGGPAHALHELSVSAGRALPSVSGLGQWVVETLGSGLAGLVVGLLIVLLLHLRPRKH